MVGAGHLIVKKKLTQTYNKKGRMLEERINAIFNEQDNTENTRQEFCLP